MLTVPVIVAPVVADGRVAVTDMKRLGAGANVLALGTRGGDDDIVVTEVERLKGPGAWQREELVFALGQADMIEPGGANIGLRKFRELLRAIGSRVDGRLGPSLCSSRTTFSAPPGETIQS
jgi:hypothetical protein